MPQPIDLQTELARTMAAERIQDAAARASLLAQQRAQTEEDKVRLLEQAQVGETPKTDGHEVNEQEEQGEQQERGRRRKAASSAPAETQPPAPRKALEPGAEHGFDVSV